MQRLQLDRNGVNMQSNSQQHNKQSDPKLLSHIVPDDEGNLLITIPKSKPILGIAIEGGANTKHPLPRIINIHVKNSLLLKIGYKFTYWNFFHLFVCRKMEQRLNRVVWK